MMIITIITSSSQRSSRVRARTKNFNGVWEQDPRMDVWTAATSSQPKPLFPCRRTLHTLTHYKHVSHCTLHNLHIAWILHALYIAYLDTAHWKMHIAHAVCVSHTRKMFTIQWTQNTASKVCTRYPSFSTGFFMLQRPVSLPSIEPKTPELQNITDCKKVSQCIALHCNGG